MMRNIWTYKIFAKDEKTEPNIYVKSFANVIMVVMIIGLLMPQQ